MCSLPFLCLYCLFKNVNGGLLHEVRIKVETVTKREKEGKKAYLKRYGAALIAEKQIAEEIETLRLNTMLPSARNGDGMPHGLGGEFLNYMGKP